MLAQRRGEAAAAVSERPGALPRLLLVEVEYAVARLTAEHDWAAGIVADIESGALPWPDLVELTALAEVPPAARPTTHDPTQEVP